MPVLHIAKNGEKVCTIGTQGLFMFSADVWGDQWSEEASHLSASGSTEEVDGKSEFLMWVLHHKLQKGDRLSFLFRDGDAAMKPPEIAIDKEEAPSNLPGSGHSWPPSESEIAKFETRPVRNQTLAWRFSMNERSEAVFRLEHGRQQLSFGLLWNNRHPERIRVSAGSTSLREALARSGGVEYIVDYVPLGSTFELQIGA